MQYYSAYYTNKDIFQPYSGGAKILDCKGGAKLFSSGEYHENLILASSYRIEYAVLIAISNDLIHISFFFLEEHFEITSFQLTIYFQKPV